MVLVLFQAVLNQIRFRSVRIGDKVRANLIDRVDQIGVDGERIGFTGIADRTDALALGLDRVHDPDGRDQPKYGWLPVHAFYDPF